MTNILTSQDNIGPSPDFSKLLFISSKDVKREKNIQNRERYLAVVRYKGKDYIMDVDKDYNEIQK